MDKGNGYQSFDHQSITLIDFFIVILKYKSLIITVVLFSLILSFTYMQISKQRISPLQIQTTTINDSYSSETMIDLSSLFTQLNPSFVKRISIFIMSDHTAKKILSKYRLSRLHYMSWDAASQKWIFEKLYSWEEKKQKLMLIDQNNIQNDEIIPTVKIKFQNNLCSIGLSGLEPDVSLKISNDYLTFISEYFRSLDLDKINGKIDLYKKMLANNSDKTLRDRVADQLIVNMDYVLTIKNAKSYPYEVLSSPTVVKISPPPTTRGGGIILFAVAIATFIITVLFVFFLENLKKIEELDPVKYNLLKQYMRFSGSKNLEK